MDKNLAEAKPTMVTAVDTVARARQIERSLHASRHFGKPDVPSYAHSVPTVFIEHPRLEQAAFGGKANVATAPITGERQFVDAPAKLSRMRNSTTREERTVGPEEAFRLSKHGWFPMGVVPAPPRPAKPIGRL